jgi:predicted nucleic acid-binding protein
MTSVFADTSYWIALADSADSSHRKALELTSRFAETAIVTTDEVLAEYLTFFRRLTSGCAAKPLSMPKAF